MKRRRQSYTLLYYTLTILIITILHSNWQLRPNKQWSARKRSKGHFFQKCRFGRDPPNRLNLNKIPIITHHYKTNSLRWQYQLANTHFVVAWNCTITFSSPPFSKIQIRLRGNILSLLPPSHQLFSPQLSDFVVRMYSEIVKKPIKRRKSRRGIFVKLV